MPAQTKTNMIYQAIANILKEVKAVAKDRKNPEQGYKYRGIDDIYNEIHELFGKYGVFSTSEILSDRTEERISKRGSTLIWRIIKVRYIFYATDGSTVATEVIGEGMDTGDKAANCAMAAAHKYAISQLLVIPTNEPKDSETKSPEVDNRAEIKSLIDEIVKIMKDPIFTDQDRVPARGQVKKAKSLADYRLIRDVWKWRLKIFKVLESFPQEEREFTRKCILEENNPETLNTVYLAQKARADKMKPAEDKTEKVKEVFEGTEVPEEELVFEGTEVPEEELNIF